MIRVYRILIFGILSIAFLAPAALAQQTVNEESAEGGFFQMTEKINANYDKLSEKKGTAWKPFKRLEHFWSQRVFPSGKFPDANDIYRDYTEHMAKIKRMNNINTSAEWEYIGKNKVPKKNIQYPIAGIGRVNCIDIDPENPSILWAGASFGGVWKSTDDGETWASFPFTEFLSIGISDLEVAPGNSSIVYAATGDANAAGVLGQYYNYTIGVIKTTNGGATWQHAGLGAELDDKVLINAIAVHPEDPNTVFAGTNKGLYKTIDGGVIWDMIHSENAVRDILFKPDNPDILIGSYYKIDQNSYPFSFSIKRYDAKSGAFTNTYTYPSTEVVRVDLAVTKADAGTVYALASKRDMHPQLNVLVGFGFHSLNRSYDGGSNWAIVNDRDMTKNYLGVYVDQDQEGGQGLYDLAMAVSPTDENEVFIGGINIWKSNNGGGFFQPIADGYDRLGSVAWVHADIHCLEYSPNGHIYTSNDGGVNKSTNGGTNWIDLSDGLNISCYYSADVNPDNAGKIVTGSQDNSSSLLSNGEWKTVLGGDGMRCMFHPRNPDNIFVTSQNGQSFAVSSNGGASFNMFFTYFYVGFNEQGAWVPAYCAHYDYPNHVFVGLRNFFKVDFTQAGQIEKLSSFTSGEMVAYPFTDVVVAPSNPDYVYGCKGDFVILSKDGGMNWEKIYDAGLKVTDIEVDPNNHKRAWFALSGYTNNKKVIEYSNNQAKIISDNLPNVPVNVIKYQKNSPERLYIGTDLGVYYSRAPSRNWISYNTGLPNVVVADLAIHEKSKKIIAGTYGRGLWQGNLIDCEIEAPILMYNSAESPNEIEICEGDTAILAVEGNYKKYEWSNGAVSNQIKVTETGRYSVIVTGQDDCTAQSEEIYVVVYEDKDIEIRRLGDKPCEGDVVKLRASLGFANYEWSNGGDGVIIEVTEPGVYTVIGRQGPGCESHSEEFKLEMEPRPNKPQITIDGGKLACSKAESYQWIRNGEDIEGAVNQTFTPVSAGEYQVRITGLNGCSNISDVHDFSTSVKDFSEYGNIINLRPNPTDGLLLISLKAENPVDINIQITNSLGSVLIERSYSNISGDFSREFDLNGFPAGAYFVKARIGGEYYLKKVIKE